jgi:argininosuccinate synthase
MVNGEVCCETERRPRRCGGGAFAAHPQFAKGATYAQSADWGVEEAEGFIKLFGMSSTLWAQVTGGQGLIPAPG